MGRTKHATKDAAVADSEGAARHVVERQLLEFHTPCLMSGIVNAAI